LGNDDDVGCAHMLIMLLLSIASLLFSSPRIGHAEEIGNPCKGLRAKGLVLCWKKMDPQRARGDHDTFHREQNAVHLKWHQEHRGLTDAQVTLDHQKFHHDTVRKHQEFHRSAKTQGDTEKKEMVTPAQSRDVKAAPNRGLSKKRQLRRGK